MNTFNVKSLLDAADAGNLGSLVDTLLSDDSTESRRMAASLLPDAIENALKKAEDKWRAYAGLYDCVKRLGGEPEVEVMPMPGSNMLGLAYFEPENKFSYSKLFVAEAMWVLDSIKHSLLASEEEMSHVVLVDNSREAQIKSDKKDATDFLLSEFERCCAVDGATLPPQPATLSDIEAIARNGNVPKLASIILDESLPIDLRRSAVPAIPDALEVITRKGNGRSDILADAVHDSGQFSYAFWVDISRLQLAMEGCIAEDPRYWPEDLPPREEQLKIDKRAGKEMLLESFGKPHEVIQLADDLATGKYSGETEGAVHTFVYHADDVSKCGDGALSIFAKAIWKLDSAGCKMTAAALLGLSSLALENGMAVLLAIEYGGKDQAIEVMKEDLREAIIAECNGPSGDIRKQMQEDLGKRAIGFNSRISPSQREPGMSMPGPLKRSTLKN